jgi:hypothetical protein
MSRLNSSQDIQLNIALDELKSDLARYANNLSFSI